MNKKELFAIETLIPGLFIDAIHDTVRYYLKKCLLEIRATLKIKGIQYDADDEVSRHHVFIDLLKAGKLKVHLLSSLDKVIKNKTDIITEILKQYELEKGTRATVMHDQLIKCFDSHIKKVRHALTSGKFEFIYKKRDQFEPG